MTPIPDLVRDSKLNTRFVESDEFDDFIEFSEDDEFDGFIEFTKDVRWVSRSTPKERRVRRKRERWIREWRPARGNFGKVWLERCIQGDNKGEVRAVKRVRKLESSDYYRELEAIALFSHSKVNLLPLFIYHTLFHT